jgi:hypothetical protein
VIHPPIKDMPRSRQLRISYLSLETIPGKNLRTSPRLHPCPLAIYLFRQLAGGLTTIFFAGVLACSFSRNGQQLRKALSSQGVQAWLVSA